jgi:hypothetical protein
MPQASFAMFKAWIKRSNVVRTLSCPFGRWDAIIVEIGGVGGKRAWDAGWSEEPEPAAATSISRFAPTREHSALLPYFVKVAQI